MSGSSSETSGKQTQISKKRRKELCPGLLDLPDPLLVLILEHVDVVGVVRFGAVNRRLRSLPCLVSRLKTTISGPDELVLLRFLENLAAKGACLRELNVFFKKTDWSWNGLISQTRYESCIKSRPDQDPFQHLLPGCTGLVNLELCGTGVRSLKPEAIQQLVPSCPRLQSLHICYYEPCHLNLVSSSLEKIKLRISSGVSVTLDTPALADLSYSSIGGELGIYSHALKRLMVKELGCESEFQACPSAGNLEYLCIQDRSCLGDTLARLISGGCVDVLVLGTAFEFEGVGSRKLSCLSALLEPLICVRSLRISHKYLEDSVIDAQTLNWLGVEEVVLDLCAEHNWLLADLIPLLFSKILRSSSTQKMVIEWRNGYEGAFLRQVLKKPVEPDFAALSSELYRFVHGDRILLELSLRGGKRDSRQLQRCP